MTVSGSAAVNAATRSMWCCQRWSKPTSARLTVLLADLDERLPGARPLAPLGRCLGPQGALPEEPH